MTEKRYRSTITGGYGLKEKFEHGRSGGLQEEKEVRINSPDLF